MTGRATILPVAMVIVILLLALIAMSSGRSDAPNLAGDGSYPHHVCTFNDYCVGDNCTRDAVSFVIYLEHENGEPRIDFDGFAPAAEMTTSGRNTIFESSGGDISGAFTLFSDRKIDFTGTSNGADGPTEHFGTGRCERLQTP